MRFDIQNLNEKGKYKTGTIVRHGRWWLNFDTDHRASLHCEWNWFCSFFGVELSLGTGDNTAIGLHVACCLISVWISLDYWKLANWISARTKRPDQKYGNGRTFGMRIFDGTIWFDCYHDPMEWRSSDPKWQHFNVVPMDVLFGRPKYSERDLDHQRVEVPMPEAAYPATVKMFESTWKRPRLPWAKKIIRAEITPDKPIPFPGKGENSWDCGGDATHSMTCAADSPFKAAMALSESVMRDRVRHGGQNWRPAVSA